MSASKVPPNDLVPLKAGNSDLLKRLQSFLPQMANANQELESKIQQGETIQGTNPLQIDASLLNNENQENDSEHSDDSGDDEDEGILSNERKQTIEMTVTLGNLESNPILSLLSNDDDECEDSNDGQLQRGTKKTSSLDTVDSLAKRKLETKEADGTDDDKPLFTVRSTRRKTLPSS